MDKYSDKEAKLYVVGQRVVRKDSRAKVTGEAQYAGDIRLANMLYGKALRSEYPHAKIISIDTEKAKQMLGVHAVITAKDLPGKNRFGLSIMDQPVLAEEKVRMMGDPVALVAAETLEQAKDACEKIKVTYEKLPGVYSIEDAIKENAPLVHEDVCGNLLQKTQVIKGSVEEGFKKCRYIVENTYTTQRVDHGYIEPETSVAFLDESGILNVQTSTQYPFRDRRQIAPAVNMPFNMVRVTQMVTGGAFGGKDDITTEIQAAVLALATKHPVKVCWSRSESMVCSTKRHPMIIKAKTGCDEKGKLQAMTGTVYSDKGAYCSIGHFITKKAGLHLSGPYMIPNIFVETFAVYTNNGVCGPYRGFGILQSAFVHESQMDQLAEKIGISPMEIRKINALKNGLPTATNQVFDYGVGFYDTLIAAEKDMAKHDLYEEVLDD